MFVAFRATVEGADKAQALLKLLHDQGWQSQTFAETLLFNDQGVCLVEECAHTHNDQGVCLGEENVHTANLLFNSLDRINIAMHSKPRSNPILAAHKLLNVKTGSNAQSFIPLLGLNLDRRRARQGRRFCVDQSCTLTVCIESEDPTYFGSVKQLTDDMLTTDDNHLQFEARYSAPRDAATIVPLVKAADDLVDWLVLNDALADFERVT